MKSKYILTAKDRIALQQPLAKNGYSNPWFDKFFGKDKNPYTGSERDRSKRKRYF